MIEETLLNIVTGGATGLLGSIFTGIFSYFEEKRKNAHEIEMRKLDMEEMDKEWEYRQRAADREADIRLQESADDLQKISYANDTATYSAGHDLPKWGVIPLLLVDLVRGLIRPSLTVLLIWMIYSTRVEVMAVLEAAGVQSISVDSAMKIYNEVVSSILYCGTTALLWWFGSRQMKRSK
ncbi:hypothetical protein [Maridesulfovibrio sp.]|uniref:hypothetical protein n=1 Tax=Maridesulfovibrio sp. TaxID=2795000 RepID=UPI0029CA0899|nr:hypothetical protein [Maridesulfovibrio sp.]